MPSIEFTIRAVLANSVDLQDLQDALQKLATFFGPNTGRVIPISIEQPPQAEFLIRLASQLGRVSEAAGFARHLRTYVEGVSPAFFVTCLGAFVHAHGFQIEFEPITRSGRRADLAASSEGATTVFECKSPETHLADVAREHERIFDTLHSYLPTPHTVTLRFRGPLTAEDLTAIGESIQRRLPSVREDGVFLTRDGIEVSLDTTMDPAPSNVSFRIALTAPDPEDNTRLPGLMVVRHGKKMAIYGPKVNVADVLTGRLRKASKQAPLNAPFVVAISSNTLLGSPRDHRLTVLEQFQPKKYTRISGVLIADFPVTTEGEEQPSLRFVANPYATHPVPSSLRTLLGSS